MSTPNLDAVIRKCSYMLSLPGNRIKGFEIVDNTPHDTAYYVMNTGQVGITKALIDNLYKNLTPVKAELSLEAALTHEGLHSVATKHHFDPKEICSYEHFLFNRLEDCRINQSCVSLHPYLTGAFDDLYKVILAKRETQEAEQKRLEEEAKQKAGTQLPEAPAAPLSPLAKVIKAITGKKTPVKPDDVTDAAYKAGIGKELNDLIAKVSEKSYFPNFELHAYSVRDDMKMSDEAHNVSEKIIPKIVKLAKMQPDYYDKALTNEISLKSLRTIRSIIDDIAPYVGIDNLRKIEKEMKDNPSLEDVIKEIDKELQNRPDNKPDSKDKDGKEQSKDGKPQDGKDGNSQNGKDGKPQDGQGQNGKPQDGQGGKEQSKDGKPQDGQGQNGKPQDGQGQGQPGSGQPGQGNSGNPQPGAGSGQPQPSSAKPQPSQGSGAGEPAEGSLSETIKGMSTEELKALKEQLEEMKNNPMSGQSNGGKTGKETNPQSEGVSKEQLDRLPDPTDPSSGEGSGRSGYNTAAPKPVNKHHDMVGLQEYSDFLKSNYPTIRAAGRYFSNFDDRIDVSGPARWKSNVNGPRIHTKNVAKYLTQGATGALPPFFQTPNAQLAKGHKIWKLEKLFFSIDGSGSMDSRMPLTRQILGIIYEAARRAKIPVAATVAYDGRPSVISTGTPSDKPTEVIKKFLGMHTSGGTNISEGSLRSLVENKGATQPKAGRLIMVTDCETSEEDIRLIGSYAKKLDYPALILGIGNVSCAREVSRIFGATGNCVIYTPENAKISVSSPLFKLFANWMKDPDLYKKRHGVFTDISKVHSVGDADTDTPSR